MRVIKNIDGVIFSGDESAIFAALKEAGFKVGKKPLAAFLANESENAEYLGFSVVREAAPETDENGAIGREADFPVNNPDVIGAPESAPVIAESETPIIEAAPAPIIDPAIAAALATIAALPPEVRAALFPAAPAASSLTAKPEAPKARGKVIASVAPRRTLTPIRKSENGRDSKIYAGLKLLLEGADIAALEAANVSGDITDFVMRRVTKRGYGINVSADGIIRLVFPEGVSSIATK